MIPSSPISIAPFYVEVASAVEAAGDSTRAAQLLRKSAMLLADAEPARARDLTVDALVLEAKADGVDRAGKAMLLGTARDLDPDAPRVGAALATLDAERGDSTSALRERLAWTLLAMFAGLLALAGLASRVHRPKLAAKPATA